MNRNKGLLAFLCTVLVVTCAMTQVPLVQGLTELARSFSDTKPEDLPALAIHLSAPDTPQLPPGPGQAKPVTLAELRKDQRPNTEIQNLANTHRLPFGLLKAHLAIASQGITSAEGLFWPRLPEGDDQVSDDGLARSRAAAALLAKYRNQVGSEAGALTAWQTGVIRARHASADCEPGLEGMLAAQRLRLLAYHRNRAGKHLCAVWGLAMAMEAVWPVAQTGTQVEASGVRLEVGPGQKVAASMPGQVSFSATDGSRGLCVEIEHACQLRSQICGLAKVSVSTGKRVQVGTTLGTSGQTTPWFGLQVGTLWLDPRVLQQPESLPGDPASDQMR
ncbi:MAG: M23 family metallopeptidase [Deltaproteobacteria bacterium]|nr:M23 family metallopeptidase [Deltaproteobacteria bacterium]